MGQINDPVQAEGECMLHLSQGLMKVKAGGVSTGLGESQTTHDRIHPIPHSTDSPRGQEDPVNDADLISLQTKHVEDHFGTGNQSIAVH